MIINNKQAEERLTSNKNILNQSVEMEPEIIRKDGINNHKGGGGKRLSPDERVAIATLSELTGDDHLTAEIFGIHPSHSNDLKNGNRNVGNGTSGSGLRIRDVGLIQAKEDRIESHKLTIQERAAEKLLNAFGIFDEPEFQDSLKNSKPKEVASVMKDMSQVMRNLSTNKNGDVNGGGKSNVKITLYAPKTAKEESFDVVEIRVGA